MTIDQLRVVYTGRFTTVWTTDSRSMYQVKHGVGKAHTKTFKGESAWSNAQRFCWDQGDLTCNL